MIQLIKIITGNCLFIALGFSIVYADSPRLEAQTTTYIYHISYIFYMWLMGMALAVLIGIVERVRA